MEEKGKISEYRSKLDQTLSSPDLTNDEMVHTLVKNQILQSLDSKLGEYNDYVVERRSKEVSDFLSELRSASVNDERLKSGDESQREWKVKQDTHELRVMYREGPEGTPYHSLLCEGFVDGPVDVCLCISYESDIYKKWFPQLAIPTFRVITSQRVQKVRMGEQISVVRVKLSWPMSSREVLLHYFIFEYFQDGLVVVLLKSISDSENINRATHGFTRDGLPDPQDVVRMDLFGGFALQKVSPDRSYFRTIANMDIKLDFVPPSIINFISRQLVGSGFKLYKKEVASLSKADAKFREALKDPLYTRIHKAIYDDSRNTSNELEEQSDEAFNDDNGKKNDDSISDFEDRKMHIEIEEKESDGRKSFDEGDKIEELEERDSDRIESLDDGNQQLRDNLTDEITEEVGRNRKIAEHFGYDMESKLGVSREVRQALETLEKTISVFREWNNSPGKGQSEGKMGNLLKLEDDAREESISSKKDGICVESSKIESAELISHASRKSSDSHGSRNKGAISYTRETHQSKIAPASPDVGYPSPSHIKHIDLHSSMRPNNNGNEATKRKNKKMRFCCLSFSS